MTPAAEWLVDNYYIVDEHIRAIRRDLPPGYYKQLPKLARGPLRGYPRVYGLAWALVAHATAASSWTPCFGSFAPISGFSRSPSANCGRSRSRCGWC